MEGDDGGDASGAGLSLTKRSNSSVGFSTRCSLVWPTEKLRTGDAAAALFMFFLLSITCSQGRGWDGTLP